MSTSNLNKKKPQSLANMSTRNLVLLSLFAAIGVILSSIELSIFPAAPHLKFDPGDIPILLAAMQFGPVAGLVTSLIVSFVQSFLIHGSGGIYGFIMHILASASISIVVGILYNRTKPTITNMIFSFVIGSLAMILVMAGANMIVTPMFIKSLTTSDVAKTIVPIVLPFNALKAGINCVATAMLYKALEKTHVLQRFS